MSAVPEGYKQTEVGVIPQDWLVKQLGQLITSVEYGSSAKSNAKGRIPVLRMGNLQGGKIDWNDLVFTDDDYEIRKYSLVSGDVLFNRTNTTDLVGKTSIYEGEYPAIFAGYLIRINVDRALLDPKFLNYILNTEFARKHSAKVLTVAIGQANINGQKVKTYPIPTPPTVEEQRAIAAALSDVDALIAKLDQLIAKKRDLKQATMQQLLTGQTRLPGFSGEWSTIRMSKHASLKARIGWQALTTAEYLDEGEYYLVTGTDFVGGRVNWSSCQYVDQWRYDQDRNIQLRDGDVLLTKDGTIGKVGYVDGLLGPATLNSGVFVIRPLQESFVPLFLFYILRSKVFDAFLAIITAGSTIVHLYQKDFVTFEFLAPSIEEQTAIATVLSDMDAELAALEARRDKTRALKQGMMQELLTGRIRLV